jgi:hypothetical protein
MSIIPSPTRSTLAPTTARSLPSVRTVGVVVVASCAFGAAWSIHYRLPYAFGGHGSPGRVAADFVRNGTALAPPLTTLVVLALALVASQARARWAIVADVVIACIGVLFLVGNLAEPSARTVFEPAHFDAVQALLRILGVVSSAAMLGLALREGLGRARRQPSRTS